MSINHDNKSLPAIVYKKAIENHQNKAAQLMAAVTNHYKAASYLKQGNYGKAEQCAILAKEYLTFSNETMKEREAQPHVLSNTLVI